MGEAGTQDGEVVTVITRWVEYAATGIELLAVVIIVAVILTGTAVYIFRILTQQANVNTYRNYRHQVARALLLGLEILVAADVIRTIALEPTLQNAIILGLLVLIRTFLGWSLVIEIEERWPWKRSGVETEASHLSVKNLDEARSEKRL
jgi:uncharacterized membrane protein